MPAASKATGIGGMTLSSQHGTFQLGLQLQGFML